MQRVAEAPLSALASPFQAGLGAFCQYNYDVEASEDRSSDERYDGPVQPSKLVNSGPRQLGATSSQCRGVSRSGAVACAPWVPSFLSATYFQPCERHRHHKKNECTFFCITCGVKPHSVCQHCMGAHAGHQVIQVRRYVYCDVVRACDIVPFVDASGVQNYIINSAKVMFLNHRPHSKIGRANGVDICRTCHRHLREGYSYCSLACKVEALTKGETVPPCSPDGPASPAPPSAAAAAAAAAAGVATATTTATSRARPASNLPPPLAGGNAAAAAAISYSSRPRSGFVSAAASRAIGGGGGGSGPFAAAAEAAAPPPGSPELAAAVADASCAALSSDPESSEPGEDTYVFGAMGGGGGGIRMSAGRRSATAAVTAATRRTVVVRDTSSYGSASSKEEESRYEVNFENPPKRRRTTHITRRPSTSNDFSLPYNGLSYSAATAAPRAGAADDLDAAEADAAAAAAAAATLLMPFRTTSNGLLPVPPAPLPPSAAAAAAAVGLSGGAELAAPAGSSADLSRSASAAAVLFSRRKQHAPQRAPSC